MAKSMFNLARTSDNQKFIDRTINRKSRKGRGRVSPDMFDDDGEAERIERDYIKETYKKQIFNKSSARRVMNTLLRDPKTGIMSDFNHLLRGAKEKGKDKFVDFLFNKYGKTKSKEIEKGIVKLRSGREIKGLKANSRIYLVSYNGIINARNFKTGKFVKFKKSYLNLF